MAIEKRTVLDQVEFEEGGAVRLRFQKQTFRDGELIHQEPHRALAPTAADVPAQIEAVFQHFEQGVANARAKIITWPRCQIDHALSACALYKGAGREVAVNFEARLLAARWDDPEAGVPMAAQYDIDTREEAKACPDLAAFHDMLWPADMVASHEAKKAAAAEALASELAATEAAAES